MNSEHLSQRYWEQVPHADLDQYASDEKTAGDLSALESFLDRTDNILDLGCGWGRLTCALAQRGYPVSGVDLSANLVSFARKHAADLKLRIQFDVGSMLHIPYPPTSFNKVVCLWGVFNHLLNESDQLAALNEMHRVLKPGGSALIEMGNGESKKYRQIMASDGYGPENRIWNSQYKAGPPPNVLYLHDRSTLEGLSAQSIFEQYRVKFQNINHKRRIITYLVKT